MKKITSILALSIPLALATGCGSSSNNVADSPSQSSVPPQQVVSKEKIKLNQLGYLPVGEKIAVVPNVSSATFEIIDAATANVVYQGALTAPAAWDLADNERVKLADFTDFTVPGRYAIKVKGVEENSYPFEISSEVFTAATDALLKSYYLNRSGLEIDAAYAGKWARAAGHADTQVTVHASAASDWRPEGSYISSPKGWYDAGDYGKYIVNSGISTYTMLAAYAHFPEFYANRDINIPESGNAIPDILDEAKWNLDWIATMQDEDGGVYHKLTTLKWPGVEMPDEDQRERFVIGKTVTAALDFAATMAAASRVYKPYEATFPGMSQQWLAAAEKAWQWALANPDVIYVQPADVESGQYEDINIGDEFAWAAAELFVATKNPLYFQAFQQLKQPVLEPSWQNVSGLPYVTLLNMAKEALDDATYQGLSNELISLADGFLTQYQTNPYRVAMVEKDFVWGSNGVLMNKAMILVEAYRLTKNSAYRDAALGAVAYLFGRNPTDYSYVTGFGSKPTIAPHHRISAADNVAEPYPGMVAGGPHAGRQDGCSYPSSAPAKNYLDHWCSYSTNEIAINWNAPAIYVLTALQQDK